jgi:hypothetical protein
MYKSKKMKKTKVGALFPEKFKYSNIRRKKGGKLMVFRPFGVEILRRASLDLHQKDLPIGLKAGKTKCILASSKFVAYTHLFLIF